MSEATERSERFDRYLGRLTGVIGHADRHEPLKKYCVGLLLPSETNKSVEPMAARISPNRVSAEHQSLLHFVGQAPWSDAKVLRVARQWALPEMERHGPIDVWIIDESGIPKKGKCSVGVANQYCGQLGKNANSQVMVSVSVANDEASLPVAHRLYLPQAWADDPKRRKDAHVPEDAVFARKWEIALDLIDGLLAEEPEVPRGTVAADAVYGDCFAFRNGLTKRGVPYAVHVSKTTLVWPQGKRPQPAEYSGKGRPEKGLRRTKEHQPVSVLDLARSLPERKWTAVTWREGTDGDQTSRFAALRVRPARKEGRQEQLLPQEWLLIEWPEGEDEPTRYWLSTEDKDIPRIELIRKAKLRWRIERDYQDLKQELGFGDYQGRGWRGFHHHITLCIAAYAFLLAERAGLSPRKPRLQPPVEVPPLPRGFRPRGSPRPA